MDFTSEPLHSSLLHIQEPQPFNAEPPAASLVEFALTPEELVYCRNHGPVREFDEESYTVVVKQNSKNDVRLRLSEVKANLPLTHVVAVLQVYMWAWTRSV